MIRRPPSSPLSPYTTLSRSGGQAVLHLATYRTKVARAEEGNDVAVRVGVEMHAAAGEAEALRQARVLQATLAVIEHRGIVGQRSEEHTSELQSQSNLVCRLL